MKAMRNNFLIVLALIMAPIPLYAQSDCVILLHGLARTSDSMDELEAKLSDNGYTVVNMGYPSRDYPIEQLAILAIKPALRSCTNSETVHFVTHSLGGILVRQYLSNNEIPNLGRVVMLGPPNQGSEVIDKLGGVPGFHFINGDAGLQLGTDTKSIPSNLGPVDFSLGIIAGTKSMNWVLSSLIPGVDDGKVSIERTKIEGMADHIEMPVMHPFMMKDNEAVKQVIHYLENGRFRREGENQSILE